MLKRVDYTVHKTAFIFNQLYSQQLPECPEYSLANVEHLLARKKSGDHHVILAQYL